MADGELHKVSGHFVADGGVIDGDSEFGEEGNGRANAANTGGVVATEGGVEASFFLEAECEQWFDGDPLRTTRGFEIEERVIARNHGGDVGRSVLQVDDGEVVVSVVIISPGLAGEAHAGERAKLSLDVGFEVNVEVDEGLWD